MLNKRQLFSFLLLALTLNICGRTQTQAADNTAIHMNYQIGNRVIKPLDPLLPDPSKPVVPLDPTNPNGPAEGTGGSLSLDFASSFQFGNQAISTKNKTYYATTQEYTDADGTKKKGPNYVQVSDIRGSGAGWRLSVKQNSQFQTAEEQELAGAELIFDNGEMVSNLSSTYAPAGNGTIVLPLKTEVNVVTATNDKGLGTWLYRFGSNEQSGSSAIQ